MSIAQIAYTSRLFWKVIVITTLDGASWRNSRIRTPLLEATLYRGKLAFKGGRIEKGAGNFWGLGEETG